MAESKSDPPSPGENVKAPNVFERVKEEFEAVLHNEKQGHHHHKETHGLRGDIDVNTSASDVKAPNVFERAKEEIEAIVGVIHGRKESRDSDLQLSGETRDSAAKDTLETEKSGLYSEKNNVKAPTIGGMSKEKSKSVGHKPHRHHKETHGTSYDFDENTPISEFKGPNVFERAKEEIEALVHTIHHKKDTGNDVSSAKKKGWFPTSIGKGSDKMSSPQGHNNSN
ncbi:hypothetical protein CASFOL_013755 [Castilleja foliolosa]|uniref:Uncharacterized protein n=1 Tax=Castilleja foliolosa TaxID=1961234 RepID=A0ABD3DPY8_9LAMI